MDQPIKVIKETVFSLLDIDPYSIVSPCAYETAWLAMIPHPHQPSKPMFEGCLSWVLNNQTEHGFWGICDGCSRPTLGCLSATLACIVALRKWNVGPVMTSKGLEFMDSSDAKKLLKEVEDHGCPRWFAIVFPGMVDLAEQVLKVKILKDQVVVRDILFKTRKHIFETEGVNKGNYGQLLSYLEVLPSSSYGYFEIEDDVVIKHLCDEGSLFQSPSATARAFMATGNPKCLHYLQSLVRTFSNNNITGVPATYPTNEDLIKLCIINHVQRLGLTELFTREIEQVLHQVYKNYGKLDGKSFMKLYHSDAMLQLQILKDSLAFRLLRMHGYKVFPRNICWFLNNEEIKNHIETNYEYFWVMLFNLYRATDLAFQGEFELGEARKFSRKLLEKSISMGPGDHNPFYNLIEHELSLPWMARLDHLEYRFWIEETKTDVLWMGKTSFQRLLSLHNEEVVTLAILNYEFRQSLYKTELEQLTRWSNDWGLSKMGFGREKTTYCYFAVAAACCSLPYDSPVRIMVAKSAILITVADDFFDTKGSLISELKCFTEAIQRWDGEGLCDVSKKIFDALDNLVREMATKYLEEENNHDDITNRLREIWYETILSWLAESKWIESGIVPSMDEYLQVGMTSIATHTLLLPASCFLKPSLPNSQLLRPTEYESITKLVMIICRLLNDTQSIEKEKDEGKPNSVTVYMKENPEVEMEEAIKYLKEILNKKKKELLEHVLIDGFTNLPKQCRLLYLSCLKVFQMFFNSSNRYDSDTEMLEDIGKAIYIPLKLASKKNLRRFPKPPPDLPHSKSTITKCSMNMYHFSRPSKHFVMNELCLYSHKNGGNRKMTHIIMPPKLNLCSI